MRRVAIGAMVVALLAAAAPFCLAQGEELVDPESLGPDERARQLVVQAEEALAKREYGEAEKLCQRAMVGYRQELLTYWVLWQARTKQAELDVGPGTEPLGEQWLSEWDAAPQDPIASFKAGIVDEADGRYEAAAQKYQSVLDNAFDDPIVYARLGVAEEKLGRHEQAAENLEEALKLDPSLTEPYESLPAAYLALKRWPEAEQALDNLLASRPDDRELLYEMAQVQAAQGRAWKALGSLLKGCRHEPGAAGIPAFGWWLPRVWATRATWTGALLLWLIPTAIVIPLWWFATRERPGRPEAWFAGINLLLALGLFSPLTAGRFPVSPGNARHQLMVMCLWWALLAPFGLLIGVVWRRTRGRPSTKTSVFASLLFAWFVWMTVMPLLALKSEYILNAWAIIGVAVGGTIVLRRGSIVCRVALFMYAKKQRYDKATSLLKLALRIDRSREGRAMALACLGNLCALKGDREGGLHYSERAIELRDVPMSGIAAAGAASACADMGRYEAALSFVEKARALCGKTGPSAALPDIVYAYVMMRQRQHHYALQALDAIPPKHRASKMIKGLADVIRARSLAMLGDFPTATQLCQDVLNSKGHPSLRSEAHTVLGIMWATSENWEQAMQQFFNATEAHAANAEAWLRQAQILATTEAWDEAREALEKTVEASPLSTWARIAIEKLESDRETWAEMDLEMPHPPEPQQPPAQPEEPLRGSPVRRGGS